MTKPFGGNSIILLNQTHPQLQKLFLAVNRVYQCTIISGGRSIKQEADFFNGTNFTGINPEKKVLSKTMDSKHIFQSDGYSHAIDVVPDPVDFNRRGYNLDCIYFAGKVMEMARTMSIPIRYGGDFNMDMMISNSPFMDLDHFELHEV